MRHEIDIRRYGPQGEPMARAVAACVHCGFCLPTCPTYATLGEEMDSPRGRIFLMKEVLEGGLELETALPFIDNCLGCLACQTACPSGVQYGELVTPFRAYAEQHRRREPLDRVQRALTLRTLPYPRRLRAAARLGRLVGRPQTLHPKAGAPITARRRPRPLEIPGGFLRACVLAWRRRHPRLSGTTFPDDPLGRPQADDPLGRLLHRVLPQSLAAMLRLLPERVPAASPLPEVFPAQGERRARVALLAGCAQQVLAPDIGWATLRVLARNGVETVVPRAQGCCGALSMHTGAADQARRLARRNLDAFPQDVDAVVVNAAGCGSGMREYGLLFAGEPEEDAARRLAERTVDVSVLLAGLGLRGAPPALPAPTAIAYQDACHLAHAQGVRREPRDLLAAIGNVRLVEPAEWELCCGSAGTYNVEKPDVAAELGRRKAHNLLATGADVIAGANIGCLTQVQTHLRALGRERPVLHVVQVLDRAYAGAPMA